MNGIMKINRKKELSLEDLRQCFDEAISSVNLVSSRLDSLIIVISCAILQSDYFIEPKLP